MRIALGSDMAGDLPEAIDRWLRAHGHDVGRFGALAPDGADAWPSVGTRGRRERSLAGTAEYGVLCCWTGTGVSIAANKVAGDPRGALRRRRNRGRSARMERRQRALPESSRYRVSPWPQEMLEAWFAGAPTHEPVYRAMIDDVRKT